MTEKENNQQEILLETGTNEVEIIEFTLRSTSFGINVAKVKQLIKFEKDKMSHVHSSPESVMGLYVFGETTIPIIDLGKAFLLPSAVPTKKSLVMVCEFSQMVNGFFIDDVKRIHRLSWNKMRPIDELTFRDDVCIIGTIDTGEKDIPVVNLESLILLINPELKEKTSAEEQETHQPKDQERTITILVAEDSGVMRKQIVRKLNKSGFENVIDFPDGLKAFEAVKEFFEKSKREVKPITDYFQLIVTDIEMPQMDGLTLCKQVKKELRMEDVIIIAYSSLINQEMAAKCYAVGADAHVSKPQMDKLVETIKGFLEQE